GRPHPAVRHGRVHESRYSGVHPYRGTAGTVRVWRGHPGPVIGRRLLIADRLIDGTGAAARSDEGVLVEDGRIAAVGRAADLRTSDVAEEAYPGCTILPGLIDSHVHLELSAAADHDVTRQAFEADRLAGRLVERATANARAALTAGVTTLRDCGSTLEVLRVR